ncbi:MAG: LamG domain-containing protein, partial [Akkermansiaceae bacterium]|nr:LamG domain-containing protein [Akkermansiaceae bacterium]
DGVETNTGTFAGSEDTGTDPNNPDSDGDGFLSDGQEVATGSDPNNPNDPSIALGALFLDGNGDFVTFPNPDGLIPSGNDAFTIEAWINPTSIPQGGGNGGQITCWG